MMRVPPQSGRSAGGRDKKGTRQSAYGAKS
jgi:hypothetical protein